MRMPSQILLIDIGNTNLKWSLLAEDGLSAVQAAPHGNISADQLALQCWQGIDPPDRIYLASVANETLCPGLSAWMWQRWHRKPQIIRPQATALGVQNGYDDPAQLGVDRWLTLLAVHTQQSGSACIVDCGTALTIDLLDRDGVHHGGLILPGLGLMRESLLSHTHIPRVGPAPVTTLFATNTASAVASAAINSAAALIERVMREAAKRCTDEPRLILTGSDARTISTLLTTPCSIDQSLVMKGLAALAMEQTQ